MPIKQWPAREAKCLSSEEVDVRMSDESDLIAAVRSADRKQVEEILNRSPEAVAQRDPPGATALHYAAENGDRALVKLLLDAGADINARDSRFNATPAGWAIEYLRQQGGLLGIEIEDARRAIELGDVPLLQRYLQRFPALRKARSADGTPLSLLAASSGNRDIARVFEG